MTLRERIEAGKPQPKPEPPKKPEWLRRGSFNRDTTNVPK